ncbi:SULFOQUINOVOSIDASE [Salix viminalis]|uniref:SULFOQUINOVOSIDASE n=1 Tax=Salix viminalis TaxID=40686 RepID=A0A9Q0ZPB6_SALVM|nr:SULFOQUINOVOSIDASE [Salix viminalis]
MGKLKITKKHHKHLNNPFPSTPKSLPFIQGRLLFNSQNVPSNKIFSVGKDFQLLWSIKNGGSLSIYHQSQPTKTLWSTIPGQAFVTAALCETEVEESRGSFAVKDRNVYLLCDHQTIEDIRVISEPDHYFDQFNDLSSGNTSFAQKNDLKDTQFPALMITGWLFSNRRKKRHQESGIYKDTQFATRGPPTCARYWVLFDQKNNNQIGFQVRVGPPNFEFQQRISPTPLGRHRRLRWKLGKIRRRKLGWFRFVTRSRGFVAGSSSSEEEMEMKAAELTEFNRICITYSSEGNERFYGFGEQFSHMDFKGKRVPIFVQEQGIGRGDQPITFAANLVSYRAGGDWSTTYAPSPFYMTSMMRSLYLEGYDYSVFDMTRHDKVQIQIQSNSVQGRILNGNSPSEIIENFTENIGRPPELPKWIISGAVVGMQGGTEAVRRVWDELKDHSVPISAFWLQDWVGQRETMIGSQLWWNWEVDTTRYHGWQQLIKDLGAKNIKVMTYCNPLSSSD